jgi:hypothetical protein
MANTYVAIAKTVLTTTQATITFSSIPSSYTDLIVVCSARNSRSDIAISAMNLKFNNTEGTAYSFTKLTVTGLTSSTVGSARATATSSISDIYITTAAGTADTFNSVEIYIPNYSGATNKLASISSNTERNTANAYTAQIAGLFSDTTAISRIDLTAGGYDFVAGSRFDLYGIKNS